MNLESYYYNCSPDYIDSIDPSLQVQVTSIINQLQRSSHLFLPILQPSAEYSLHPIDVRVRFLLRRYLDFLTIGASFMAGPHIRIVIVDDSPLYREMVRKVLEKQPNLQVVAEAGDGVYALQAIKTHRPDIVLMDITLPFLNGIEAARKIRTNFPKTKVIILTMHTDQAFSDMATQAGACRFLTKDCGREILLQAIRECSTSPSRIVGHPPH